MGRYPPVDSGYFIALNYPPHYLTLALDSKHVKKFDFHKKVAGNQVNGELSG
jgi:hypothetical protein